MRLRTLPFFSGVFFLLKILFFSFYFSFTKPSSMIAVIAVIDVYVNIVVGDTSQSSPAISPATMFTRPITK